MPGLLASKTSQKTVPGIKLQPVLLVAVKIASLVVQYSPRFHIILKKTFDLRE